MATHQDEQEVNGKPEEKAVMVLEWEMGVEAETLIPQRIVWLHGCGMVERRGHFSVFLSCTFCKYLDHSSYSFARPSIRPFGRCARRQVCTEVSLSLSSAYLFEELPTVAYVGQWGSCGLQ